jgi:hypothetical protein
MSTRVSEFIKSKEYQTLTPDERLEFWSSMPQEEVDTLSPEDNSLIQGELTNIESAPLVGQEAELDTTPAPTGPVLQGEVSTRVQAPEPEIDNRSLPPMDDGNILTRSLEAIGGIVSAPFKGLWNLASSVGNAVKEDPLGAAQEVGKTGYALSPMGAGERIAEGITGINNQGPFEWLGGGKNELANTQNALLWGIGKGVRDIGQGINELPADIGNLGNYILSGDKSPKWGTIADFPDIPQDAKQLLQDEPIASAAGQITPQVIPALALGKTKWLKGLDPKKALLAESAVEAGTGGVTSPGDEVTDPIERIGTRTSDAAMTGGAWLLGKGGGMLADAAKQSGDIKKIKNTFGTDIDAKTIYEQNKNDIPGVINRGKKAMEDIRRTEKGAYQMTPEETAGITTFSGKVQKNPIVLGQEKDIKARLKEMGHSDVEADALYQKYKDNRKSASYYEARVQVDRDMMRAMGTDTVAAPSKPGAHASGVGGLDVVEKMRKDARVRATKELQQITGLSARDAIATSRGLQHPLESMGNADTLTSRQSVMASFGVLPSGQLADTTPRAGIAFKTVREQVPKYNQEVTTMRDTLNGLRDELLHTMSGGQAWLRNPAALDIAEKVNSSFQAAIHGGYIADAMKGDYSRMSPEIAAKVKPVADKLRDLNENTIIPKIRKLYGLNDMDNLTERDFQVGLESRRKMFNMSDDTDTDFLGSELYKEYKAGKLSKQELIDYGAYIEFDPATISNSQRGAMVHKVDTNKLKSMISPQQWDDLVNKVGSGDPDNPTLLFGYYDSPDELVKHLTEAKDLYKKDMPWLYDKKGRVNKDLIISEDNKMKIVADLEYQSKLDKPQFIKMMKKKGTLLSDLVEQTGIAERDLDRMINDFVITGNLKDPSSKYRRFIGSLMQNEGKLLTQNVDPFKTMNQQFIELTKREKLGPVVNAFIEAQQKVDEELKVTLQDPIRKSKLLAEQIWFEDMEAVYRGTPHWIDTWLNERLDSIPMPENIRGILYRNGKWVADQYVGLESQLKLALNFSASSFNILEAVRAGLPELGIDQYKKIATELGMDAIESGGDPIRTMQNSLNKLIDEVSQSKVSHLIFTGKDASTPSSVFGSSDRLYGSRTLGKARDVIMMPFEKGTEIGKLITYKIYKTVGESQGLFGDKLDDFIIKEMARTGSLTDLSKIPLQERMTIAKPMLLFKAYMIRLADLEMGYWEKVLADPTPDNIIKASMFGLMPAVLLGVQTSPSLNLAMNGVSTFTALKDIATGEDSGPNMIDQDRAKGGWLTSGAVGASTGLDTSVFVSDLAQLTGIDSLIPVGEAKSVSKWANEIAQAKRLRLGDTETKEVIKDANQNLLRDISVPANRLSRAADVLQTGRLRDRKGEVIEEVPQESRGSEAAQEAFGFRSKERTQEELRIRIVRRRLKQMEQEGMFLQDRAKDVIRDQGTNAQERLGDIQDASVRTQGKFISAESLETMIAEKDMKKKMRIFNGLPQEVQIRLIEDPTIRPLLEDIVQIEDGGEE